MGWSLLQRRGPSLSQILQGAPREAAGLGSGPSCIGSGPPAAHLQGGAVLVGRHIFSAPGLPGTPALYPSSLACLPGPALSSLGFQSHNSSELAAAHGLFSPTLFPRDRAKLLPAIQEELGIHKWTQRSSPGPSWRKGAVQRARSQRDGQTDPTLSPGQIPLVLCPGDSRLPPPGTSLARKGRLQQFPWALGSFGGRGPLLSWGCGPRPGPGLEGRETLQN